VKTCDDFGPESACCSTCHHFADKGQEELMVIRRPDGTPFAKVCCANWENAEAALNGELHTPSA